MYKDNKTIVKTDNAKTADFEIKEGLKQEWVYLACTVLKNWMQR